MSQVIIIDGQQFDKNTINSMINKDGIIKTTEHISKEYNISKNCVYKTLKTKRDITSTDVIDSYGGVEFLKNLVRKGYNLKMISKALNLTYAQMMHYCKRHDFSMKRDMKEYINFSLFVPTEEDIMEAKL